MDDPLEMNFESPPVDIGPVDSHVVRTAPGSRRHTVKVNGLLSTAMGLRSQL